MNSQSIKATFLIVMTLTALTSVWAGGLCDHKVPSSSVGACDTPPVDGSWAICGDLGEVPCEDPDWKWEVNEDFPTSCNNTIVDYNCDQPLKKCRQPVQCEWVRGSCQVVAGSGTGLFIKKKKRTATLCWPDC